ncbi:EamA family transporter [Idiomarina xiamenensis]|uniref:Malonate decarboxylase Na+ pump n=1 Tax=Idiomarina xiamenensis 10-D-4 TaxID=740709 RepID=K2KDS2_9GAMM|nr:EamA family transporter [Idiomarina xiamenensis]EKE84882.1 malonate decarboxylase Na+ pump [Idiomarina xiamenensis 10-D-4]
MITLWLITLLWALSFSLIGEYLAGQVDPYLAVFIRMLLALLLFLPLLKPQQLVWRQRLTLAAIGALQIGVMYLFLYQAFLYLSVAEVLLFTIFTPLYINLVDECLLNRRHLPWRWWLAAAIAVLGAAIIRYQTISADFITGFLLIQAANFCFAAGQVAYKRLPTGSNQQQLRNFAWFFVGASLVTGLSTLLFTDWQQTPSNATQWGVLLWLGLVASGVGYLCWNLAAKRVNTGQLATMNNMLIPAGIIVNAVFWQHSTDWVRLLCGAAVITLAVALASRQPTPRL